MVLWPGGSQHAGAGGLVFLIFGQRVMGCRMLQIINCMVTILLLGTIKKGYIINNLSKTSCGCF